MQWNAEGVYNKKVALAERLQQENIDIACLQETHLKGQQRLNIRGFQVFKHNREGRTKGGAAILVKNSILAKDFVVNTNDEAEIQGVEMTIGSQKLKLYNAYCPQDKELSLEYMEIPDDQCLIVGDFNSHSEAWGYAESDRRGDEVEDWQVDHRLILLNDADDPLHSSPEDG